MWKEKKSIEFCPTVQNLPQTVIEVDNFISVNIFELKCGRDLQYPTYLEELLSIEFCPTIQKSSTNWNVEDNFILEYIHEICST